jgi:hypothetical protein
MSTVARTSLLIGLVAIGSAGCATTRAEAPVERPALDVPMPPPRVIVPLPPPQLPLPDPVPEMSGGSPAPARPRPSKEKESPNKPEAKPEEKPAEPPAPTTPAPVPQLRIPETTDSAQLAAIIDRTLATLEGIDWQKLQPPRQKAYNDAKLFASQAREALDAKDLVIAKEFAEKAERLVKELTGR